MLSLSAAKNADYYARLARCGYYASAPEEVGKWYGEGAYKLGLRGEIEEKDFLKIFRGVSHKTEEKLVRNAGDSSRRNAYDLTFSDPKSVSAFWAISDKKTREKIEDVRAKAIEKVLDLASDYVVTRTGKGGINREKCSLVYGLFNHSSSRAEEPNLHTHAILMNLGVRENGKTSALDVAEIYRLKMTLGALYRAELARGISKEFGVDFERINRSIELVGRSDKLCDYWSTRSKEIDKYLKDRGESGAKAAARACISTRSKKDMNTSREDNLKRWLGEAEELGVTQDVLLKEMRRRSLVLGYESREEIKDKIEERLFKEHSHFTGHKLFQTVAEECQTSGFLLEEIVSLKDEIEKGLKLLYKERNGVRHYTTFKTIELEEEYLKGVKGLNERETYHVKAAVRKKYLSDKLSDEQKLAFLHVTNSGQLKIVEGLAGSGKTSFLRQAVSAWKEERYRVIGTSLAAVAADNLAKEAGIDRSYSLEKLLRECEKIRGFVDLRTVVVLDEAAMVGTFDLNRLLKVAKRSGAKLVWVGDRGQLQAIHLGGGFAGAADRIGKAEVSQIWRQEDSGAREVVYNAARGSIGEALRGLNDEGRLEFLESQERAREELIEAWQREKGEDLKDTLILTSTVAGAERLNEMAQEVLFREGRLGKDELLLGGKRYFAGDRIMFGQNSEGFKVKNGQRGAIEEILGDGRLRVFLDSGETRFIDPKRYGELSLAYACTTHKAQGQTKDRTYILVDEGMISREMFYVQVSRQRKGVRLFINCEGESREEAYKQFLERISRSNQEVLAHDLAKKLKAEEVEAERLRVEELEREEARYKRELEEYDAEWRRKKAEEAEPKITYEYRPASEVVDPYREQFILPIKDKVLKLSNKHDCLKDKVIESSFLQERRIKELLCNKEYKKTQELLPIGKLNAERAILAYQGEAHRGGWWQRRFSKEYRRSLKESEIEAKTAYDEYKRLQEKLEGFDSYLGSDEGKAKAQELREKFSLAKKMYDEVCKELSDYDLSGKNSILMKLRELKEVPVLVAYDEKSQVIKPDEADVEEKYKQFLQQKYSQQHQGRGRGMSR
jgi:conjugative relaxase-like TrwC/TraI family protein